MKRFQRRSTLRLGVTAALLLPTLTALPFGTGTADDTTTAHTFERVYVPYDITTTPLPGGMVHGTIIQRGEAVATFIARAGTTVELIEAVAEDGQNYLTDLVMNTIEATSEEQTLSLARDFRTGLAQVIAYAAEHGINYIAGPQGEVSDDEQPGPTVYIDSEQLLGSHVADETPDRSEPGYVWDSGCASINTKKAPWHGCYQRWTVDDRDPNYWYSGDQSQATGHGTFWTALTYGKTEHRYNHEGLVVKWKPGSQQDSGKCRTVTMTLSMEATTLSDTHQVCPARIRPAVNSQLFKAVWEGWNYGGAVESTAEVFSRAPNGRGNGHQYWIGRGSCTC